MTILEDITAAIPAFQALIDDAGETVTLIKKPATAVNASDPWLGQTEPTDGDKTSYKAVPSDPRSTDVGRNAQESFSIMFLSLKADMNGFVPAAGDQLEYQDEGRTLRLAVGYVDPLRVSGQTIAYEVFLKG